MKLSDWARHRGITYTTAWRWVKEGKLPVPFEITPSGTILVHEPEAPKAGKPGAAEPGAFKFATSEGTA
ncbi:hypothetical protein AB1398_10445, partial [Hydrogenibacillus schlegelii]